MKTKTQISAFVFATWIVQFLYFPNPKFQASSHLLWLYSPVCARPGRKPPRPVFSQRGSYEPHHEALSFGFPTRFDPYLAVQPQKMTKGLKILDLAIKGIVLSRLCSKNKGVDQLGGYQAAELSLCFHICYMQVFS